MSDTAPPHLLMIGEMGSGKTTVGRALARELDVSFLDSDAVLEAQASETGSEIAARGGVGRLHDLELEVFLQMVGTEARSVIAPAASVIDSKRGRSTMADHLPIWLDADDDILVERQQSGSHRRLVHSVERGRLRQRRAGHYAALSLTRIDTGANSPEECVDLILAALPVR